MQGVIQQIQSEEQRVRQSESQEKNAVVELERMDRRLADARRRRQELVRDVAVAEGEVTRLSREIAGRQDGLNRERDRLLVHLRLMYGLRGRGLLKLMLAQDDVDRMRQVLHYFGYLLHERQEQFARFAQGMSGLQRAIRERQGMLDRARGLIATLQSEDSEIERRRKERSTLIATLRTERDASRRRVADLQKSRDTLSLFVSRMEQTLDKYRSTAARGTDDEMAGSEIDQRRGALLRPVAGDGVEQAPGMFFRAAESTVVRAVFRGQVVYADWFLGYGLLVILDHGDHVYSLYGHNSRVRVASGEWVEAGEPISDVGDTGSMEGETGLYFEIRRNGRAESPRQWLKAADS